MAVYDHLPVFRDTYDLLLHVIRMSGRMQRDFRYTVGEKLRTGIMDLCICIYKANGAYDRAACVREAREKMVVIKLQLRVLRDMKQISVKQFALAADKAEAVSKQLALWGKYLEGNRKGKTEITDKREMK